MIQLECQFCHKIFIAAARNRTYCSKMCANRATHSKQPKSKCISPGCDNIAVANWNSTGMCKSCWSKAYKGSHEGICKVCGLKFMSRTRGKIYCSMSCHNKDPDALARLRQYNEVKKVVVNNKCLNCGKDMAQVQGRKPSQLKRMKFCSDTCRRTYFADRFDRWMANPETLALPQCYDEFLLKEELPCLVAGCDWVGRNLGMHVNRTHGVTSASLKELAGFNRRTGLVTRELHEKLSEKAIRQGIGCLGASRPDPRTLKKGASRRLEAKEHIAKVRAIESANWSRQGVCAQCGGPMPIGYSGRTRRFCSVKCRSLAHSLTKFRLVCDWCGKEFMGTRFQKNNHCLHNRPTACSNKCKGEMNMKNRTKKRL